MDDQRSGPLVPERELLHMTRLNLDVLGSAVQNEALRSLDLAGDDHGSRLNAMQDDLAGFVCVIEAVIRADSGSSSVHHPEGHAGKGLVLGALDELGCVIEIDGLRVVGVDYQGLRPGVGVNAVAGDCLQLRHDDRAGDAGKDDLAVAVCIIDAVDSMSFGKEFEEARKASNFNGLRLDGSRQAKQ